MHACLKVIVITGISMYIVDLGDDLLLESHLDQETNSDAQGGFPLRFNLFRTLIFIFECLLLITGIHTRSVSAKKTKGKAISRKHTDEGEKSGKFLLCVCG